MLFFDLVLKDTQLLPDFIRLLRVRGDGKVFFVGFDGFFVVFLFSVDLADVEVHPIWFCFVL